MGIKELIDSHKYISFDIFDTLIKRNVNKPVDVFQLIEIIYKNKYNKSINGFKSKRIHCEKSARNISNEEEVTLDEIYIQLNKYYDKDDLIKIKALEIECESSICRRNDEIIKWFDYAKSQNKYILITSDMYLEKHIIENILKENNINGYNAIFLSSEIKKTKYRGSIYKLIINELKCKPNEIVHIGDNIIGDIKKPDSLGIDTYYVKGSNEGKIIKRILNKLNNRKIEDKDLIKNIINNFIKNNCSEFVGRRSEYYIFGYKYLGLLLYSFLQWIDENCAKNNIERLYFFSRDGYILNKAYNDYYIAQNDIKYSYLYVSRRALIVPTIENSITVEQLMSLLNIGRRDTIATFFEKIGLNSKDYSMQISQCGFEKSDSIDYKNNKDKINKLFNLIKEDVVENAHTERIKLVKYLEQEKVTESKKIGIVDIGWRGSMQYVLDKIIGAKNDKIATFGYYLGLNNKSLQFIKQGMKGKGYLFNPDDTKLENKVMGCIGLIESFFTAPHGSVIGYDLVKDNNTIVCKLDEYEYESSDIKIISEIQEGALDFIKDFSIFNKELCMKISNIEASNRIIEVLINPTYQYACKLGDMMFSDFGINYIAKPKCIGYYLRKPKSLYNDLVNSTWKIGFMRRLFKIKFPYDKVYNLLKIIAQ